MTFPSLLHSTRFLILFLNWAVTKISFISFPVCLTMQMNAGPLTAFSQSFCLTGGDASRNWNLTPAFVFQLAERLSGCQIGFLILEDSIVETLRLIPPKLWINEIKITHYPWLVCVFQISEWFQLTRRLNLMSVVTENHIKYHTAYAKRKKEQ